MAEIIDVLRLQIDDALRDVGRVEQALDRALAPVELDIQVDERALAELENTLNEVQRIADRAATETQSIALAAGRAEVNFEDLARAMGITEAEARDLTAELLDAQAASNRLEDSSRDVARQLGLSESEANRLTTSLRQADRAAEAIDVSTAGMVARFGGLRTAAAGVAGAFAAIGGAALFGGALRGAQSAITQFAALNESINAVRVTFGSASDAVFEFGESSAQSAGLSAQAFQQAVVPIGAVLTNFGFNAREAASASIELVQRAADLASVFNTDVNEALLSINSALVGQVEPLRRYGAEINAARVEAFALANGLLVAGEEMDTATAVQARFGLILADTNRVAGDFVNTSDEYANASRIAAAEVEKLQATLGEALLPAFESLLTQAPQILAFFDSLVPQLAATAESAAEAGAGLASFVSAVTLGFGQLGDVGGGVFDVLQTFPAVIEDIAAGIIDGDASFRNFRAQFDQFNQRTAQTFIRTASQSIPQAISRGDTAVTAFGNAIAFLGRQDDNLNTIEQAFDRLRRVAGLTDEEAQLVTQTLIDQAAVLGFNADEVRFLTDQWEIFRNNLTPVGNEIAHAARAMAEVDTPFRTFTSRFTTFTSELEEIPDRLSSIAVETRLAAGLLGEALNPFDDAAEDIDVSAREFFNNLTRQINEEAQFQRGIVELILREQFDLAEILAEQGPPAQSTLEQFLADIDLAQAAEDALSGQGTEASRVIEDEITRMLAGSEITPQQRQAFLDFMNDGLFTNTQVEQGIVTGAASSASKGISSFLEALIAEGRALEVDRIQAVIADRIAESFTADDQAEIAGDDTVTAYEVAVLDRLESSSFLAGADVADNIGDIFASDGVLSAAALAGLAARSAFFNALSSAQPGEITNLRSSITETIDSAIFRDSPPKLFLDAGRDSGEAFWSGFNQADLTLRTAPPSITGGIASGTTVGGVGGVHVELTTINPIQMDQVSDHARMAQIAGSVAQTYNAVRN